MEQNKVEFSDEENDNIEDEENELPEEDEMDAEMRAYIFKLTTRNSIENDKEMYEMKKSPIKKKKKIKKMKKEKNIIHLDFNSEINLPQEPKKWESKRLTKKGSTKKEYKFKPRMMPYEYREQEKKAKVNLTSNDDFPEL